MKTSWLIITLLVLAAEGIQGQVAGGYMVAERGAGYNILQKTVVENGTNRVHRYVAMATGMNYTNSYGQLTESRERVTLLPTGGAAATQGRHQVFFPADIYDGLLEVVTPDDRGAQYSLGYCYANGVGVMKDEVEAVKWFRKAAEQNDADAQRDLGTCYHCGLGVVQDEVEAMKWFHKAAGQNDAGAQYNLGICYFAGQGVAKDELEAAKWWRKAADQNDADAQHWLGVCYANGEGVAKNYSEAHKWLYLAAAQGHEDAKEQLPLVDQKMTPEQIVNKGRQLAREFKPRKE